MVWAANELQMHMPGEWIAQAKGDTHTYGYVWKYRPFGCEFFGAQEGETCPLLPVTVWFSRSMPVANCRVKTLIPASS